MSRTPFAVPHRDAPHAGLTLAAQLAEGRPGLSRDPPRAKALFEQALRVSPRASRALVGLAFVLQRGGGGLRADLPRAARLYQRAIAVDGDADACFNLALILSQGAPCIPRNVPHAAALWERAAAQGNIPAKRCLARLLEAGAHGVPRDRRRAVALYEHVVHDHRFKSARFNLAWLLSTGADDVPQDLPRAARLYQQVIDEDSDVNSMFNLACLLAEGKGPLPRDLPRAVALFQRAVDERDHVYSMHTLGVLLSSGPHAVQKDIHRAVALLERAVECGRHEATFDLALVLSIGQDGQPVDLQRAAQRYEEVIRRTEHIGAMINLAEILFEGRNGVEQDVVRARQLCQRAIAHALRDDMHSLDKLGITPQPITNAQNEREVESARQHALAKGWHLIAMCCLAGILMGDGVPEEMETAVRLFEVATADASFAKLCNTQQLDVAATLRLLREMTRNPVQTSLRSIVRIYDVLIGVTKDASAMYFLGNLLMDGARDVPRDRERGVALYKRAAKQGEKSAMIALGELVVAGRGGLSADKGYAIELFSCVLTEGTETHLEREAVVNLAMIGLST